MQKEKMRGGRIKGRRQRTDRGAKKSGNQMRADRPGTGRPPRRSTKWKPTSRFTSMRLPLYRDIEDGELGYAAAGEKKVAEAEDHPAAGATGSCPTPQTLRSSLLRPLHPGTLQLPLSTATSTEGGFPAGSSRYIDRAQCPQPFRKLCHRPPRSQAAAPPRQAVGPPTGRPHHSHRWGCLPSRVARPPTGTRKDQEDKMILPLYCN
jgi:hypothetical protein